MREVFERYYSIIDELALKLLSLVIESLGHDAKPYLKLFDKSLATLRILRYPKPPENDTCPLSCDEHCDSGVLTLLLQDEVGGLQVQDTDMVWKDVKPVEDSYVVNVGQLLEKWTDYEYRATMHRVLKTPRDRFSVPFFMEPNLDAKVDFVFGEEPKGDREYGEYLVEKIKKWDEFRDFDFSK